MKGIAIVISLLISAVVRAQSQTPEPSSLQIIKYINLNGSHRYGIYILQNVHNLSMPNFEDGLLNLELEYSFILSDEKYIKHSFTKENIVSKTKSRNRYYYTFSYSILSYRVLLFTTRLITGINLGFEYQKYYYTPDKNEPYFLKGLKLELEEEYTFHTNIIFSMAFKLSMDVYDQIVPSYFIGGCIKFLYLD